VLYELRIIHSRWLFALLFVFLVSACGVSESSNPTRQPTSTLNISVSTPVTRLPPTDVETLSATDESVPTTTSIHISTDNIALLSPLRTIAGHEAEVTDVALSADGALLVSASRDGTLRVWRTVDGTLFQELSGHSDVIHSVDISADGSMVVSGSDDRTAGLWRLADGALIRIIHNELLGRVLKVAFSPDGNLIAMGGHRCIVELRSTWSGTLRRTLAQPFCSVTGEGQVDYWGLAFSTDGSQIVTGEGRPCCGGSLQLWQVEESVAPRLIRGYDLVIRDVAISPDGETLATALVGSPFFWLLDIAGNEPQRTLEGHRLRVNDLEFSPSGEIIASASRDGRIGLWDVESGALLRFLEGDGEIVTGLDFSADGSLLVAGLEGGGIILWGLP
jgi:WD40 repeat protein